MSFARLVIVSGFAVATLGGCGLFQTAPPPAPPPAAPVANATPPPLPPDPALNATPANPPTRR